MGISYYLSKETFGDTVRILAEHMPQGSCIAFDYPDISRSRNKEINKELAKAADETMQAEYSLDDIEAIADNAGLLIYENSDCSELDDMYFANYNLMNKGHEITAPQGICCCLLVKKNSRVKGEILFELFKHCTAGAVFVAQVSFQLIQTFLIAESDIVYALAAA